jgi:hypothetical protein
MTEAFLTITEAVQYTGKSRRTLHRLAQQLAKTAPDQVLRERTPKGMIWRIHQPCLAPAPATLPRTSQAREPAAAPLVLSQSTPGEGNGFALAQQGYASLMALHQEVKVTYEALLQEKEQRIQTLTQALAQRRRGFWQRLFGHET